MTLKEKNTKYFIFDFDGTLADSFQIFLHAAEKILKRPQKLTPLEIEELRNLSLKEIIDKLGIRPWQIPGLIVKGRKEVKTMMRDSKIFYGIEKELATLAKNSSLYILSSNSPESIKDFLIRHEMDGYFKNIYGDIGLTGKAKALRKLIKAEGLKIEDCVYIGDETRDVTGARKIGMKVASVGWGFSSAIALKKASPDLLINETSKLADELRRLAER